MATVVGSLAALLVRSLHGMDPLDEDGRRNEVDGILDGEYLRMG